MKPVAFFSDTRALPGLHVTIATLLKSLRPGEGGEIALHIFLDNVSSSERNLLKATHKRNAQGTELHFHNFTPSAPTGGNSLHGNNTAYGRLYLPYLLSEYDKCIYLDCDLFVNRSIVGLFDEFDEQNVLIVDGVGIRSQSLENKLFKEANLDMNGFCFNSGVMGINLKLWRERDVSRICNNTAELYKGLFLSADQALLNTALHDSFKSVGGKWNTHLYPSSPQISALDERIYHFVGSPKPWDFLGSRLTSNYELWRTQYIDTAAGNVWHLKYTSIQRSLRISMQTVRAWQARKATGRLL